ncbi:SPOR domain-containing protein [Oceaniglobus indicus]|uniref:SPOR domain-containing protein n=1 Tax=Oceaniglobus indicus TaxID=2047749 RepID=UPI000C17F011|nr:SPOR domain-containing protein [Oceaniglobus indicus]
MADVYDETERAQLRAERYHSDAPGEEPARRMSHVMNWTGGLLSLALIAGTGVWGYKLLVRDVTGVPVVRALEGPIRVAPDDPGGQRAEHQGLAVNEVAAAGSAGAPGDRLILAPAPLELAEEDLPRPRLPQFEAPAAETVTADADTTADTATGDLALGEVEDIPEDSLATDRAVAEALQPAAPMPELTGDSRADALALAEALSAGVEPLSGAGAEPEDAVASVNDDLGIARSPRPPSRPASLETVRAAPVRATNVQTVSAETTVEVAADSLASGTRLVQLGAFESAEVARAQWDAIGGRFEEYFAGKSRVVQRAQSGGKTFYRLRAMGFEDLADSRRFCSALLAKSADCIPVVVR